MKKEFIANFHFDWPSKSSPDTRIRAAFLLKIKASLLIILASYALNAFATQPISLISIQQYEKKLNIDHDKIDISTVKSHAAKAETFLKSISDYSHLSHEESQALGKLFYKLGIFYTRATHEHDRAINKMISADAFLTDKKDKAWNYNHLAYAYEQKFAISKQESDKEHAIAYLNKVIANLYANAKNKEVAFAYCVKGLLLKDEKYDLLAELSFRISTEIYQSLPDAKNTYAMKVKQDTPRKCSL